MTIMSITVTLNDIQKAYKALKPVVKHTPIVTSKSFSEMAARKIFLKLENLQSTGSFKIRGAYNRIRTIAEKDKRKGVVCASAGNHAQGVAYASTQAGIKSTIFMPSFTPALKVIATKSYGGQIRLEGASFDEAKNAALEYVEKSGGLYIPPFDDDLVIAGQGTIGLEILKDNPDIDSILIPVGGGGLIAGVAIAIKENNPKIKIIGVEAEGAAAMKNSIDADRVMPFENVHTIADGIAVKTPGQKTFEIIRKYCDDILTVSDNEIALTVYHLLQRAKLLVEPAGAVGLTAAIYRQGDIKSKKALCILSGGNIRMDLLQQILEKSLLQNNLRIRMELIVPDVPGKLNDIVTVLQKLQANIYEIDHDRNTTRVPVGYVRLTVSFHVQQQDQIKTIKAEFKKRGLKFQICK